MTQQFINNIDKTSESSPDTEELAFSVGGGEPRFNVDNGFKKELASAEPLNHARLVTQEGIDRFRDLFVDEPISFVSPRPIANRDRLSLADVTKDEFLASETVEWMIPEVNATEITDALKTLPLMLRAGFLGNNISAEYEVLNTSTAQNIVEYTILPGNGAGTLDFEDGTVPFKTLDFSALTQIFSKPERKVYVKLSNIVGSGNMWPKVVVKGLVTSGNLSIFGRTVSVSTGTSINDQAQRIANAFNTQGTNATVQKVLTGQSFTCQVAAVVNGNVVEFQITDEDTNANCLDISHLSFSGSMNNVVLGGNIRSDGNYIYMGRDTRKKSFNFVAGASDTLTVTIAGHGPRPGTVSLLSYDVRTKRSTKRGQVPQTVVSGLKEDIDSLKERLKNKGF